MGHINMALGTSYSIEDFRSRVQWAIENLQPNPAYSEAIYNTTALWRTVATAAGLNADNSYGTWKRCIAPKSKYQVPDAIVVGLLRVYPDLTKDTLVNLAFSSFQQHMRATEEARARWMEAIRYHANNRGKLERVAKQYYRAVDDEPGFPLVAKKGWILRKPVLLNEEAALPQLDALVMERMPQRLAGLNIDYVSLLSSSMKESRRPTNNQSYRILEIKPMPSRLELKFGTTQYFQVVNTCEAMGTELADFVRRNPESVPTLLKLRGSPESVYDFKNRSTYASVICITLLKNYFTGTDGKKRNKFVIQERGEDTVEAQNTINVMPTGGHQPLAEAYGDDREVSLWHSVVREFCEELFNKEDAQRLRRLGEVFVDLPAVKPLVDGFFRSGAARVYLLGVGLDPVTTKCEFIISIVVDWARALEKTTVTIKSNYEGEARLIDLTRENLRREAFMPRAGKSLYPAAKACLLLAEKHYEFLMRPTSATRNR